MFTESSSGGLQSIDKKYIKQVFKGDQNTAIKMVQKNLMWVLEKYKYDFTEAQVEQVVELTKERKQWFSKQQNSPQFDALF